MKILVLGSDGYIGYPLTQHLLKEGHQVIGLDNYSRRERVNYLGSNSLTPIKEPDIRNKIPKHSWRVFRNYSTYFKRA